MARVKTGDIGDRQFDVLCCLADRKKCTVLELAEHLKHTTERGHLDSRFKLRDNARRAAKGLVKRGFAVEMSLDCWRISAAGRRWLESSDG